MHVKQPPKKTSLKDWHPADIVAELRKAGWSLRSLSLHHGYGPSSLGDAIRRPWPRAERLIAEAIGVRPETIWPGRYAKRAQHTTQNHPKSGNGAAAA